MTEQGDTTLGDAAVPNDDIALGDAAVPNDDIALGDTAVPDDDTVLGDAAVPDDDTTLNDGGGINDNGTPYCERCLVYSKYQGLLTSAEGPEGEEQVSLHVVAYDDLDAIREAQLSPPGHVTAPIAWDPAGRRLAYTHSGDDGVPRLTLVELTESLPQLELSISTTPGELVSWVSWLDSDHLLFVLNSAEDPATPILHLVALPASVPTAVTRFSSIDVTISELPEMEVSKQGVPILNEGKGAVLHRTPSGVDGSPCELFTPSLPRMFTTLGDTDCSDVAVTSNAGGDYVAITPRGAGLGVTTRFFNTADGSEVPIELSPGNEASLLWSPTGTVFAYSVVFDEIDGDVGYQWGGVVVGDVRDGLALGSVWGEPGNPTDPAGKYISAVGFLDDTALIVSDLYVGSYRKLPLDSAEPVVDLGSPAGGFALGLGRFVFSSGQQVQLMDTDMNPGEFRTLNHELATGEYILERTTHNGGGWPT